MNIVFRVDASVAIGSGHVFRCLTLARALREKGAKASFICRAHEGHLRDLLRENDFDVTLLPPNVFADKCRHDVEYETWLGASWQSDAEETRAAIEAFETTPDWLVVDHYGVDRRWERAVRRSVGRIMATDDLANRAHECDILLDQNLVAQMQARYDDKVPPSCVKLLGPAYALLQPIYASLHDRSLPRAGPIRRIFIFFGGFDVSNLTGRAIAAFLRMARPDIEVDVVIGSDSPHAQSVLSQVAKHGNIHLHSGLPTLAELMAKSDLAIGAGGATTWERLCLKLYSLVVTLAPNQIPVASELEQRGLIRWIGNANDVSESCIAKAMSPLICSGIRSDWLIGYENLVDGHGGQRVSETILNNGSSLSARVLENHE